eukprot:3026547-Rhodomonas_salina.1
MESFKGAVTEPGPQEWDLTGPSGCRDLLHPLGGRIAGCLGVLRKDNSQSQSNQTTVEST